jgi:hypothetical protein
MDAHQYAYQSKYPVDPFRRDNIFKEAQNLSKELNSV